MRSTARGLAFQHETLNMNRSEGSSLKNSTPNCTPTRSTYRNYYGCSGSLKNCTRRIVAFAVRDGVSGLGNKGARVCLLEPAVLCRWSSCMGPATLIQCAKCSEYVKWCAGVRGHARQPRHLQRTSPRRPPGRVHPRPCPAHAAYLGRLSRPAWLVCLWCVFFHRPLVF